MSCYECLLFFMLLVVWQIRYCCHCIPSYLIWAVVILSVMACMDQLPGFGFPNFLFLRNAIQDSRVGNFLLKLSLAIRVQYSTASVKIALLAMSTSFRSSWETSTRSISPSPRSTMEEAPLMLRASEASIFRPVE